MAAWNEAVLDLPICCLLHSTYSISCIGYLLFRLSLFSRYRSILVFQLKVSANLIIIVSDTLPSAGRLLKFFIIYHRKPQFYRNSVSRWFVNKFPTIKTGNKLQVFNLVNWLLFHQVILVSYPIFILKNRWLSLPSN